MPALKLPVFFLVYFPTTSNMLPATRPHNLSLGRRNMKIATCLLVATACLGNVSVFASPISIVDGQFQLGNLTAVREELWIWESRDFQLSSLNPQMSFVAGVQAAPGILGPDRVNYEVSQIRSDRRDHHLQGPSIIIATVVVPERFPLWLGILAGSFSLCAFTRKVRVHVFGDSRRS